MPTKLLFTEDCAGYEPHSLSLTRVVRALATRLKYIRGAGFHKKSDLKKSNIGGSLLLVMLIALTVTSTTAEGAEGAGQAAPAVDSFVESPDPYANETEAQRDARMAWWRDAKFGMFIHWGVYSVPAGKYDGKQIRGNGEWILLRAKIPVETYRGYAKDFNPVKYDPVAWAKLAKQAGMRYMVITSKHHDGFALYPSDVTDWDIADATPYGKDLLGPLAEAARAEGLKFGLYYSQAQDWTHPGGAKSPPKGWDERHRGDFDKYLEEIAGPQVDEILTRFQPDVLWWDTPRMMNNHRAEKLIPLLRKVPGIIHNNRLGGDYPGDTETPEQHIPAGTGLEGIDWEVCMTMNRTWGYKSYDNNWKSTTDLIHKLCDIAGKGGNFLLNVGPTPAGIIPRPSIDRLKEVGAWMDVNGEAIYGTTRSPLGKLTWGRCTKKLRPAGATLYLHVFDWPSDGKLFVPGLTSLPATTSLLANGKSVEAAAATGDVPGIVLSLPGEAPNAIASVVKLEIEGQLQVDSVLPKQQADGSLVLTPFTADLHNRNGTHVAVKNDDGGDYIGNWRGANTKVSWTFQINQPGRFAINVDAAAAKRAQVSVFLKQLATGPRQRLPRSKSKNLKSNGARKQATFQATGSLQNYTTQDLGTHSINGVGVYTIELKPNGKGWNAVNLRSLKLVPVDG